MKVSTPPIKCRNSEHFNFSKVRHFCIHSSSKTEHKTDFLNGICSRIRVSRLFYLIYGIAVEDFYTSNTYEGNPSPAFPVQPGGVGRGQGARAGRGGGWDTCAEPGSVRPEVQGEA